MLICMDYSILADYYEKLENVSAKLKKTEILVELFKKADEEELPKMVLLLQGMVYPKYMQLELGIATQMMIRAISKAFGFKPEEIEEKFAKLGDLGLVVEECVKSKKQATLLKKKLTLSFVFENLRKLATITGEGSQEKKLNLIIELLVSAKPKEARYIVRTILGELRVGVAEGLIRDAIFQAFLVKEDMSKEEKEEAVQAVDYAWNIVSDFGEVAKIAKKEGIKGLKKIKIEVGRPIQVMLGEKAESIEEVIKEFGKIAAEYKYDGMHAEIHKKGEKIWIYTRRLEDVTKQFPDVVEMCRDGLKPRECIVEGEVLAINPKTGLPLPFQLLSQRIHRKYDIEKMTKEIPVQLNLFDIMYLDGKALFNKSFLERRKILEQIVKEIPKKLQLAKQIITDNVKDAEKFYKEALEAKQEGLMLKVLSSPYVFGRHVGTMYKIKPIMETLDLVIVGATWGEGARANWLTSFELGCRDPDTGKFLRCGMMSTGLTEEEYQQMTEMLKPLIIEEKGKNVKVKPKIVVEVAYQEIQKSPNYESGFALRFPRFVRDRTADKSPEEADTIERIKSLFESQGRAG
ncbi:MAG: ATP-dependent DNA ligase [Candidatus Aenigmatarchaeota archaeon]